MVVVVIVMVWQCGGGGCGGEVWQCGGGGGGCVTV